jgi:signal transduction histidine kinase
VNDRADRLLRDFTGYHLNRLDRTVADLQRRRARSLALAALAVAAGLLLAAGFAVVLVRRVVRPIVEMASAARRVEATGAVSPVAGAERTDEIGVLARAFNQMTDRLVSANSTLAGANATLAEAVRARDEFISIASHELKTPITPLVLRVQQLLRLARDGDAALPREQVVQATRSLEGHLLKLTRLIENLLDVSRINSGQLALRLEDFSLATAIREAVDRVGDDLAAAGCAVRVDAATDLVLRGDRLRLEQVLVNLLGNAAKYAPGEPVAVRARAGEGSVEIEIEDGGPGITPADQERIFHRFERASPDRHVGGLGLGLYIAREIVHAHRGELSVRSAPGRGATFTIRLPAQAAPGARAGAGSATA